MSRSRCLKKYCSIILIFSMLLSLFASSGMVSKAEDQEYKELTLQDFGLDSGQYTDFVLGTKSPVSSLDGVAITETITFSSDNNVSTNQIRIGAADEGGWASPMSIMVAGGRLYSWDDAGSKYNLNLMDMNVGDKFTLRVEISYHGEDVQVLFYVDGNLVCDNTYVNYKSKFGTKVMVLGGASTPVSIEAKSYRELGLKNFGLQQGEYTGNILGTNTPVESLDGVAITETITFSSDNNVSTNQIRIGAADEGGWASPMTIMVAGGRLYSWDDAGSKYNLNLMAMNPGDEFTLRVEISYHGEDVQVLFYVDGNLVCDNTYANYKSKFGTKVMVLGTAIAPVLIGSNTYKELTLEDFGLKDGEYTGNVLGTNTPVESLDGVAITETITFSSDNNVSTNQIRIGAADEGGWASPMTIMVAGGRLYSWDDAGSKYNLNLMDMNVGDEFTLRVEITYHGEDVQVLFYVDGNLVCDNTYANYKSKFGTNVMVLGNGGYPLIVGEKVELIQKTPEELGFKQVRLPDFGLEDGEYSRDQNKHVYGIYRYNDGLNNKYFDVNVSFKEYPESTINTDTTIRYATADGWAGIHVAIDADGTFYVIAITTKQGAQQHKYTMEQLGLESYEEVFNLKLGLVIEEKDDAGYANVTYCLWINDVLCAIDKQFYSVTGLGELLGVYTDTGIITMNSPEKIGEDDATPKEKLPTDFRQVTFGNFNIKDGTYKYEKDILVQNGDNARSLNKTIFSGDFWFSKEQGGDFRYGGNKNPWLGLHFYSLPNGRIYMQGVKSGGVTTDLYVFSPVIAETKLIENWFNLKISTELIDSDEDGKKDDLKLGVWFNDLLYDNKYIYLQDYEPYFGRSMGVCVVENSTIKLKGDSSIYTGVDWALFGYTQDWEKEIGIKK